MARGRTRVQLDHDDCVVKFPTRKDARRQRAAQKQSRRQRTEDQQERERFDVSLKRLLPTEPRSQAQADHLENLANYRLCLATGPAGTGKTYIPVAHALDLFAAGAIERIICLRPTVEAGGSLGFLPGGLKDKLDPFFTPIRRSIAKKLGNPGFADRWMKGAHDSGALVFTSIQHLRGDTLENCMVILDESQNCTYAELKLVVTRMGEGSRFAVGGDADQTDLEGDQSGWRELVARLAPLADWVGVTRYTESDVVRDPLLKRILPYL